MECKRFLEAIDIADPQRFTLFKSRSPLKVKHLAWGAMHVCVVTTDGDVYTWGDNSRSQCGLGKREIDQPKYISHPERVKMFESVKMSSWGDYHSLLLANQGIVYFFGYNVAGSESENTHFQYSPESLKIKNAIYISAGPYHNAAICVNTDVNSESSQEVYLWGRGWNYQLANRNKDTIFQPTVVKFSKPILI